MSKFNICGAISAMPALLWLALLLPASAASPTVVFHAPWGDAPGEIGIINQPEFERAGPLSFCTDGQNVFLLDSVHKQILARDASGKVKTLAANVLGWGICADGSGGVFLQNDARITHVDKQGNAKQVSSLDEKRSPSRQRVQGYGIEMFLNSDGSLCQRTLNQKILTMPAARTRLAAAPPNALGSPTKLRFEIKRMSGNEVRILGFDADGKALVSVPVRLDSGQPGAVLFKGTDAAGNLFVELERLNGNAVGLEVHSYSRSRERLTALQLPNDYFTTVYKKTEVAPDGTVYQLLTAPDGVSILRYGKEPKQ
jgi:hypothetical protein